MSTPLAPFLSPILLLPSFVREAKKRTRRRCCNPSPCPPPAPATHAVANQPTASQPPFRPPSPPLWPPSSTVAHSVHQAIKPVTKCPCTLLISEAGDATI
ncbi:hypothetical protein U1Q18_046371 [Sarracenia purpurea var. burkii]